MKHSGTTKIFVVIWASTLFASYVTGICIREIRFKRAEAASQAVTAPQVSKEVQKPANGTDQLVKELAQKRPMLGPEGADRPGDFPPEDRAGFGEGRGNMRERLENMSEEEREQFRAQMRERFAGRRREGGERFQNLSEEERAQMREEMEKLRERWEEMSEQEREEARAQMIEKYGFAPRIGEGGNRGPGGEEGGRRRQAGRQQENN